MRSAMYYPHTSIKSPFLLRNSLLLWDEVHFIVPEHYIPYYEDTDFGKAQSAAMTLIGRPRCPTKQEQTEAHDLIQDFVANASGDGEQAKLPDAFFYTDQKPKFDVNAGKFLEDTWKLLRDSGLAGTEQQGEVPLVDRFGLSIMSILTDCCAGEMLARITDRGAAYAAVVELLKGRPNGQVARPNDAYESLVPISLKVLNIDEIPLSKLIDLRQREKNGEQGITKLRHGYVDKLEDYAGRLAGVKTKSDRDQIQREFENAMKIDVANLKDALKSTKKDLTFSKEFLFCVFGVGAVGAYFLGLDPATLGLAPELKGVIGPGGGLVTAFGGLSVNNKYKAARKSLLEKHSTAFLYEYM